MRIGLGLLALGLYAIHAANCIRLGCGEEALWVCHVATAAIGVGLLARMRLGLAAGCYCLAVGTPLWLVELMLGNDVLATSYGTHLGGFVVGWLGLGLGLLPLPRGAWWQTVLGLAALQQICRWWTSEAANVNAAFAVYPRFAPLFPSYGWYLGALVVVSASVFWLLEHALRRVLPEEPA